MLGLVMLLGLGALIGQNVISTQIANLTNQSIATSDLANDISENINQFRIEFQEVVISLDEGEEFDQAVVEFGEKKDSIVNARDDIKRLEAMLPEDGDEHVSAIRTHLTDIEMQVNTIEAAVSAVLNNEATLQSEENEEVLEELEAAAEELEIDIAAIRQASRIEIEEALSTIALVEQNVLIFKIVMIGISLVIGIGLAFSIVRNVTNPLGRLVGFTERVSEGDLSQRTNIQSKDEIGQLAQSMDMMVAQLEDYITTLVAKEQLDTIIGQYRDVVVRVTEGDLTARLELEAIAEQSDTADDVYTLGVSLNQMVQSLTTMTQQIREAAAAVTAASAEISSYNHPTVGLRHRARCRRNTNGRYRLRKFTQPLRQTAERAQAVAQAARQSVETSRAGQDAVTNTIEGMARIRRQVEDIAENILALAERTQQIGEIIDTVNSFADQSKLLALNASIEAARAGEEGRGFAVVALEVRQLAEQSQAATARVRDILNEIQQATNTAVMVTEEGQQKHGCWHGTGGRCRQCHSQSGCDDRRGCPSRHPDRRQHTTANQWYGTARNRHGPDQAIRCANRF